MPSKWLQKNLRKNKKNYLKLDRKQLNKQKMKIKSLKS